MRVWIYAFDSQGHFGEQGYLTLDEKGRLVTVPSDDPLLVSIATTPIVALVNGELKTIEPNEPGLFLKFLHLKYTGSYLRAGKVD